MQSIHSLYLHGECGVSVVKRWTQEREVQGSNPTGYLGGELKAPHIYGTTGIHLSIDPGIITAPCALYPRPALGDQTSGTILVASKNAFKGYVLVEELTQIMKFLV